MARYDRIARIDPPARDDCFSGWLTLRDLDGREREPELGRRARLHFMALRPVRRLLIRGLDSPAARSLDSQVDAVREQVDQLPPEDAERERLMRYLEEIGGRSPAGLVRATLDVGAAAEAAGHRFAAEEFYRTAAELAEAHGLDDRRVVALRHLGRVQREREEWDDATTSLEASASLAEELGEAVEWARSVEALASVRLRRGETEAARALLASIAERAEARSGRDEGGEAMAAIAAAGLCALELAEGSAEAALEAGWSAVTRLPAEDETRNRVLLNMAAAFRRLGLRSAAASCYEIIVRWAAWPEHRLEARLEHSVVAAESGDAEAFERRRAAVLAGLEQVDRPLQTLLHLGLGRGCFLLGDMNPARDHARSAIATARDIGADDVLKRSEELLAMLETQGRPRPTEPRAPSTEAIHIAGKVEGLTVGAQDGGVWPQASG